MQDESQSERRRKEAKEFARVLYAIYKEEDSENDKIVDGQINAKQDDNK